MKETSSDIIDEGKQFWIKMNVPWVRKKYQDNVADNSIEVFAEYKEESEDKKKNYLRKKHSQVSYFRNLHSLKK